MIPNITSGQTFKGLVGYNEKKVHDKKAELIGLEKIASPDKILWTLKYVSDFNERCKKPAFHVSLSFPPAEKELSNAELRQIADEFMMGMGYAINPYAVYRHYDTDNQHVHIISTRIGWDGKRVNDFQEERKAGKIASEIEQRHGLILVDRKVKKKEGKAYLIKPGVVDCDNVEQHIINAIGTVINEKNVYEMKTFRDRLKSFGVGMSEGKAGGVSYYLMNDNGERTTPAIPASAIYFKPTQKRLKAIFAKNRKLILLEKERLRKKFGWLKKYSVVRQTTFDKFLKDNHLQILYVKNASGIYGVKFLDTKNNVEYKGSELGVSWTQLRTQLAQKVSVKKGDELEFIQNTYTIFLNSNKKYKESQLLANENIKSLLYKTVENATNTYYAESIKALIDNFIDEKIKALPEIKEKEKMPTEPRFKGNSRHFSDKITQAITGALSAHHGNLFDFKSNPNDPKGVIREDDDDEDLKTKIKILLGKLIK